MDNRVFIDTNVFLDLLLSRGNFGNKARDFFLKANQQKTQLLTSVSCFQTVIYVLEKEKFKRSLIKESLSYLNALVRLCNTTNDDIDKALKTGIKDLEDAILCQTAISNDCIGLITRNVKDYAVSNNKIKVLRPEEF